MRVKKRYEVELRSGSKMEVEVYPKKFKPTPPPYPNDAPQLTILQGFANTVAGHVVKDACEFALSKPDTCQRDATRIIKTLWLSGDRVNYLLCAVCASELDARLTPLCNTGSKTTKGNS